MRKLLLLILIITLTSCSSKNSAPTVISAPDRNTQEIIGKKFTAEDLFVAAENDDDMEIRLILASGDVKVNDFIGEKTAILHAAQSGSCQAVNQLIKSGANIHITLEKGLKNIYSYLFTNPQVDNDCIRMFLYTDIKIVNETELFKYVMDSYDYQRLSLLLSMKNANNIALALSLQEKLGKHLLQFAMELESEEMFELFIQKGSNMNLLTFDGETVLTKTIKSQKHNFTQIMIDHGVKIDQIDLNGKTTLIYAIERVNVDGVRILMEAGASKKIKNKEGKNACKIAKEIPKKQYKEERKEILNILDCGLF